MGDLGAAIIKIESPDLGVESQQARCGSGPQERAGRRIFYDLAARSDALLTNFRPSVLDRLQRDDDHVCAHPPEERR